MTCFCIGRNYAEHAAELGNAVPGKPLVFTKPATALLSDGRSFSLPDFSTDVHYEFELVLRVSRVATRIRESEAADYVDAMTLGVDLTARDIQSELKAKGQPWELAKAFDHSAPLGRWVPVPGQLFREGLAFEGRINGRVVQRGHTRDMIFPIPVFMAYLTRYFTLQPGDVLFTGTPAGVGPLKAGDRLEGWVEGPESPDAAADAQTQGGDLSAPLGAAQAPKPDSALRRQQKLLDFEIQG